MSPPPTTGTFERTTADPDPQPEPKKKKAITRTGAQLFERYGVRRVSVEEICREAGCSKATFYKYFSNKTALVKHILTRMSQAVHHRTDRIRAMDVSFAEKVRLFTNDRLEATRRTSETFIEELVHADDDLADFVAELTAANHRRFLDFVTDAQSRGEVRPAVKPEFLLALLGKLGELTADEDLKQHYDDYVALTREIVDFFFFGIAAPGPNAEAPE